LLEDPHPDEEGKMRLPQITHTIHGIDHSYLINDEFLESKEYKSFVDLAEKLDGLIEEGAFIKRKDRQKSIIAFNAVYHWLMNEAKRGQNISRYKGLGEMNPDQLWETTMDPLSRRMLQVTIEDAVAADQIFTTLMGDQVAPRRAFIEDNALNVENLDV